MSRLLRRYFDICLLRAGPQDLPASPFLLGLSLAAYFVVGVIISLQNLDVLAAASLVIVDTALLAALLFALLWVRQFSNRYLQTLTALLGAGVILELVAWPVLAWQQQAIAGDTITTGLMVASLLLWIWLFWNLMVIGHILRHALSTLLPIGVVLGLLYMFISFSVSRILFFPDS